MVLEADGIGNSNPALVEALRMSGVAMSAKDVIKLLLNEVGSDITAHAIIQNGTP